MSSLRKYGVRSSRSVLRRGFVRYRDRDGSLAGCRALVCETESDCPIGDGVARTCGNGLCAGPERQLTRVDVVMLCMAGSVVGYGLAPQRGACLTGGEPTAGRMS